MAQGEYTGEGRRVRSDGSTFWAGITLTALRDGDGRLLGFAKVTRDLTARRAADALLQSAAASAQEARATAESASAAKSGFLATMSHEIRTPVNAIMGYLDLLGLEIGGPLTAEQRTYVERADRGSRHLLTLVSDVLDFSRLEAERQPVAHRLLRVGDAVSQALGLVIPQARARNVTITDAVSGAAGALVAWGDESRVSQIVANLLVNAVKFTEPRTDQPGRITVSAGAASQPAAGTALSGDGPWVYIRVEDTGTGIAPDQLETIFEPFVQADMSLTRRHGGTGLGLAISRRLARAMGGEVVARSDLGVGSSFFLWLPAAPVESMRRSGLQGSGSGTDGGESVVDVLPSALSQRGAAGAAEREVPPTSLRAVADGLLADVERVLHAYVARLRSDPGTPSAHTLDEAQIEDHFASLLSDLAATMSSADVEISAPDAAIGDGTAIQRVIAERHGAQRARLQWEEREIRREFRIFREEVTAALRRRPGPVAEELRHVAPATHTTRSIDLVTQFLRLAERISLESYRRTRGEGATVR
jgi:signal transduction histidine kinase